MATNTTNLNLVKPADNESYSVPIVNENMQKIDDAFGMAVRTNLPGITASDNSSLVSAVMTALANKYNLGSFPLGTVISGRVEWSGTDYLTFIASKAANVSWNIMLEGVNRIITAYYNLQTSALAIKEVYSQLSRTPVSITPSSNVTISTNVSWAVITNDVLYLNVSGKANSAINNGDLFTLGMSKNVAQALIIPMGKSNDLWNVTSIGYAYVSARTFVGRLNANEYFHISVAIPLAQ